jgi:hypothetical protein
MYVCMHAHNHIHIITLTLHTHPQRHLHLDAAEQTNNKYRLYKHAEEQESGGAGE